MKSTALNVNSTDALQSWWMPEKSSRRLDIRSLLLIRARARAHGRSGRLHVQMRISTQRAIGVNVMKRREKVVSVYKELAVTLKASQRLSHKRIYEIPSRRCLGLASSPWNCLWVPFREFSISDQLRSRKSNDHSRCRRADWIFSQAAIRHENRWSCICVIN